VIVSEVFEHRVRVRVERLVRAAYRAEFLRQLGRERYVAAGGRERVAPGPLPEARGELVEDAQLGRTFVVEISPKTFAPPDAEALGPLVNSGRRPERTGDPRRRLRERAMVDAARGGALRDSLDRRVGSGVLKDQRVVEVEEDGAQAPASLRGQGGSAGPWVAVTTRMTASTTKLIAKMPKSRIENTT
jgi:hypothetical protein